MSSTLDNTKQTAEPLVRLTSAKVLILDEPTAALAVEQSGIVLKYIIQARERGLGVIFITHNPHHAYPVGDRFLLLNRGRSIGNYEKSQVTRSARDGGPSRATAHDALAAFDLARAAEESWRKGRTVTVEPQRCAGNVRYTVKQENR